MKVGPVHSEIIGSKGTVKKRLKKKLTSAEHKPYGMRCWRTDKVVADSNFAPGAATGELDKTTSLFLPHGTVMWKDDVIRKTRTIRPTSHLRFYRAILSCNFIARQSCSMQLSCRTLQLCRINNHGLQLCRAKKLGDKIARKKSQVWHRSNLWLRRQRRTEAPSHGRR